MLQTGASVVLAVWSTLIGRGMSRLGSHWSRVLLAPALLCHKEPARRIQSPLLGALERKIPLGGYFACSSLVLYGIRIGGFHARKGPIIGALGVFCVLKPQVGGFVSNELVLYSIRELAEQFLGSRKARHEAPFRKRAAHAGSSFPLLPSGTIVFISKIEIIGKKRMNRNRSAPKSPMVPMYSDQSQKVPA